MGYASVVQTDTGPLAEDARNIDITSVGSRSPTIPQLPLAPFSFSFDDISGDVAVNDPTAKVANRDSKVSKILSSLTGSTTSYDLVEDDDYEDLRAIATTDIDEMPSADHTTSPPQPAHDLPVRTASVSRQLPLNHPRPDLQSLQGAYVKNVERLEESAERLSMTSSLESESRKDGAYQQHQNSTASTTNKAYQGLRLHKESTTSLSNSILDVNATARSGGYSPAAYVTSPVDSMRSAQMGATNRETSHLSRLNPGVTESVMSGSSGGKGVRFGPELTPQLQESASIISRSASNASPERPGSAGSGDTYQQARNLFTDFDGVHYNDANLSRRISLNHPPRARDSRAFREPQPGEEMIFYPAPVPVMLNLPVRLSRMNWSDREKKRLQALSEMPDDMRKSAPWLANEEVAGPSTRQSVAKLPPQLRASAFFDHRGTEMNVQLKDGSAVATLESILDAAAHAPVSAFTDHPIVGHLGKEVYGPGAPKKANASKTRKAKRKSSANDLLKSEDAKSKLADGDTRPSRNTSSEHPRDDDNNSDGGADATDDQSTSERASEDGDQSSESESESESESDERDPGFSKAPTTLLAELQMRKAQQKQRNRTAADAFPNGMHSTLLELDTVTQLQQKARKQKHITLAWEDRVQADKENFDDDDVPLGMLFPDKDRNEAANVNQPLGLMEKKELEENEPLSFRRARLRGEHLLPPQTSQSPSNVDEVPRLEEPTLEENPEETLGQRLKRLREMKENGSTSDFAREVNSELGLQVQEPEISKAKTPDPEETLGQRRRRLKEEASKTGQNGALPTPLLRSTGSMADLLQRNPVQYTHPNESKTAAAAMQTYQQQLLRDPAFLAQQQAAAAMGQSFGPQAGFPMGWPHQSIGQPYGQPSSAYMATKMQSPMAGYGAQMPLGMGLNSTPSAYGMPGYGNNPNALDIGPPLNAKQRANIDQWRQGIA